MSFDITQIDHLAHLARLELSAEEKTKFAEQLASVLGYFDKLKEVDTTGLEPSSQSIDLVNIFRTDEARDCDEEIKAKILANAPNKSGNYFKVNKIL